MSVIVNIEIAGGAAYRRMGIYLTARPPEMEGKPRDEDEIGTYEVEIQNQIPSRAAVRTATFEHRYGDDVAILIAKAGEAIREKHGRL